MRARPLDGPVGAAAASGGPYTFHNEDSLAPGDVDVVHNTLKEGRKALGINLLRRNNRAAE